MCDRNASPSAFGWDFQANAAILLMIENIKKVDKIRVEGKTEDIEITLKNKTKIYIFRLARVAGACVDLRECKGTRKG